MHSRRTKLSTTVALLACFALIAGVVLASSPAAVRAASLPAETTALVSGLPDFTTLFPSPVNESSIGGHAVDRNGGLIAFAAGGSTPVAPGDPADGFARLYARNLVDGSTRLISRATGAGAPFAGLGRFAAGGITADGGCVTFAAPSTIADPAASTDFSQVYVRVLKPDCGRPPMPQTGTGGTSGSGHPPDRTAPKLTSVRLSHSRFRVGRNATSLSLRVSEAAKLTITVQRERPGKRAGTKRKPTCHLVAHASKRHSCLALTTDGTIKRMLKSGSAKIAFDGRIGGRMLAVGAHRFVLVARDAAGNASKPVTMRFTVLAAKKSR